MNINDIKEEYNQMNEYLSKLDKLVLLSEYENYIRKIKDLVDSQSPQESLEDHESWWQDI